MKKNALQVILSPFKGIDGILLLLVLALCGLGVLVVYSGSAPVAMNKNISNTYYVLRHVRFLAFAFCGLLVGLCVNYRFWKKFYLPIFGLCLCLLVAVLFGGHSVKGAERWLLIGGMQIQPAEFMKFGLLLLVSFKLSTMEKFTKESAFPIVVWMAVVVFLLLLQPNYSMALIMCFVVWLLMIVSPVVPGSVMALFTTVGVVVMLLAGFMFGGGYRSERFDAWLNPEKYENGRAYQMVNMQIALGNGGLTGQGFGHGTQKLGYIPESYTDGAFALIGEEFGFIGTAAILALFMGVLYRGYEIAKNASSEFGCFMATGLTAYMFVNMVMHVAVCSGSMPTTGQPLPFISLGGTNLCANLFFVGVLLNISKDANRVHDFEPKRRTTKDYSSMGSRYA